MTYVFDLEPGNLQLLGCPSSLEIERIFGVQALTLDVSGDSAQLTCHRQIEVGVGEGTPLSNLARAGIEPW